MCYDTFSILSIVKDKETVFFDSKNVECNQSLLVVSMSQVIQTMDAKAKLFSLGIHLSKLSMFQWTNDIIPYTLVERMSIVF